MILPIINQKVNDFENCIENVDRSDMCRYSEEWDVSSFRLQACLMNNDSYDPRGTRHGFKK